MGSSGRSRTADMPSSPADHNLIGWTFAPEAVGGGTILGAAGTLFFARVKVPFATTISNIIMSVSTAGATLTASQCLAGLFSGALARLSPTATQHTAWESGGLKTMALTSPQAVAAGYVYVGVFANGSTLPTFSRGSATSSGLSNVGLAAPNFRFGSADTGLTTAMPATIGTQTAGSASWWVALS